MTVLFSVQVKIQPVAKYDWEHKYYYGRLIAVSNSFLAYAIRGESPFIPLVLQLFCVCIECCDTPGPLVYVLSLK